MLRKKLRKRETYMRDWSTALGGEGGVKKRLFRRIYQLLGGFWGQNSNKSDRTITRQRLSSNATQSCEQHQQRTNGKIVSPKRFFGKIVWGVKFPRAAVGGQNAAGKVENVPNILIRMLLKYLLLWIDFEQTASSEIIFSPNLTKIHL